MKKELDKALVEKYPLIFADRYADMQTTAMCWGFECGDGWYNIIDTLCAAIQHRIDWHNKDIERVRVRNDVINEYVHGNHDPIREYVNGNQRLLQLTLKTGIVEPPPPIAQVVATQVKEKYGGLRFYFNGGDDTIDSYVRFAEMISERTCDVCGAPGKMSDGGWIVTRCDAHA